MKPHFGVTQYTNLHFPVRMRWMPTISDAKGIFEKTSTFSMEFIEKVADIADPFLTFNHSWYFKSVWLIVSYYNGL